MSTWGLNAGCALIASAPVAAGHFILAQQQRYILLSWLSAFVCTVFMIICSLSSLFTENPWFILLFSVPFEAIGKCLIKYFACKQTFLRFPTTRAQIGLCCGVGYSLAHVLTLYVPLVFDQPFSIELTGDHTMKFPNSLDLAIANHAACIFQIGISLLLLRFSDINIFLAGFIIAAVQYGFGALSQIPSIPLKLVLMIVISYALVIGGTLSFRGMNYEELVSVPEAEKAANSSTPAQTNEKNPKKEDKNEAKSNAENQNQEEESDMY